MYGLVRQISGKCKITRAGPLKFRLEFIENNSNIKIHWNSTLNVQTLDAFMTNMHELIKNGLDVNLPLHEYRHDIMDDTVTVRVYPKIERDSKGRTYHGWSAYIEK